MTLHTPEEFAAARQFRIEKNAKLHEIARDHYARMICKTKIHHFMKDNRTRIIAFWPDTDKKMGALSAMVTEMVDEYGSKKLPDIKSKSVWMGDDAQRLKKWCDARGFPTIELDTCYIDLRDDDHYFEFKMVWL